MHVLESFKLTKNFNGLKAVDSVDLQIKEGEIFGLLGPNGAGKTTFISMLSTILKPSSGTAKINGFDIVSDAGNVRKSIGIVFQDPSLDDLLTARENLELHAMFYSVQGKEAEEKINFVLNLVELNKRADDQVKTFSGGMRRRLEVARALIHEPKLLFLDEPTLGLDPQTRNRLWEYIEKLARKQKITILITTHYMDEAEKLCDRVGIIDFGKIIALDSVNRLKKMVGNDVIKLKTKEPLSKFEKMPFVESAEKTGENVFLGVKNAESSLVKILRESKAESAEIRKPTLNDAFLKLTGREMRDEEPDKFYKMRLMNR